MQLEIYKPIEGQNLPAVEWNFTELKRWLEDGLTAYKGRVYDETQIKEAKKDVANLRKLSAAIDSKRKEIKATYLEPYAAFECQVKELTGMISAQVDEISDQIKKYDEAKKAQKLEEIKAAYEKIMGHLAPLVPFKMLYDKRWLNATMSMTAIHTALAEKAESVRAALASIDALGLPDDVTQRVKEKYLETLNLSYALAEVEQIRIIKQAIGEYEDGLKQISDEAYDPKAENKSGEIFTVDFRIEATKGQLDALKAFLMNYGIKYGPVP